MARHGRALLHCGGRRSSDALGIVLQLARRGERDEKSIRSAAISIMATERKPASSPNMPRLHCDSRLSFAARSGSRLFSVALSQLFDELPPFTSEALFRREAKGGSVMAFSHRRTVRCF